MRAAVRERLGALRRLRVVGPGGGAAGMRALFEGDAGRFENFSARFEDLWVDFSKTTICGEALAGLLEMARVAGVEERREAMFAGVAINGSEGRAVLHAALRGDGAEGGAGGGGKWGEAVAVACAARRRMLAFAEGCRDGTVRAADGGRYGDVVNIGIGGSDLGPAMAVAALAPFAGGGPRVHFVSNIDGAHWGDLAARLDPARTLVVVSSKTFTTMETMTNAAAARGWLRGASEAAARTQVAAVTAAPERAREFGAGEVFEYWSWVGGRFSVWGAVGLPLALAVGAARFEEFLAGARAMDAHFCAAPPEANLPLLLALTGVWHRNVCGYATRAILPYDERLRLLPAYLQQLEMESNGKRALADGGAALESTVPVVWGSAGTNAQHAYFQMLHQGTDVVPCEFLAAARPVCADVGQHRALLANCLAQSAALMLGGGAAGGGGGVHREFAGGRPSVTILYRELSPYALGRLVALYEHRVFCEGVVWGVNSFDQWGVELGKAMAVSLLPLFEGGAGIEGIDGSTRGLLAAALSESE